MPESIQAKLASARRRWRSLAATGGFALCFAAITGCCLLSFYVDRVLALTSPGRWAWLIAICAVLGISALVFVLLPLRRPLADETLAADVERAYPALNERLLSTIELARAGAAAGVSAAMVSQLAAETERLSMPLDFARAVPTDRVRRPAFFAAAAGLLLFGHVALVPAAMLVWLNRILHPAADIPRYGHTRLWASPGDVVVPRGADVVIGIRAEGALPDRAELHYRFDGGPWSESSLKPDEGIGHTVSRPYSDSPSPAVWERGQGGEGSRSFTFKIADAQQSITYYATAGDGRANPHTITVEDRPTILAVKVRMSYPPYMHRRPETVMTTAGNIVAPVGTHADIEATASKPLASARMIENGNPNGNWAVEGSTVRGEVAVRHDETYGLDLHDTHGFAALNPPLYTVRAQPDLPPQVQIVKPGADVERSPEGSVDLKVVATDDYGVEEMHLAYQSARRHGTTPLPFAAGQKQAASGGPWSLAPLALKPGDVVTYQAVAADGDKISGPHIARSTAYRVRIISVAEMKERIEAAKAQEQEDLKQIIQHQKDAQAALAQAQKTRKQDAAAQAQTLQRNVGQETAELARKMQQTSQSMRDNNMAVPEEMKQREDAQSRLDRLGQKAMPHAADTIQRGDQPDAARQEQAIRQELEQVAQQSAPAADAFQLAKQAEQLAQEQQKLSDQAAFKDAQMGAKSPSQMSQQERADLQAMAKQQAEVRKQTDALQSRIQRAADAAKSDRQPIAGDLQDAARQLQTAGTQQKQSAAQQSLQAGQPRDASPKQTDAARDLQKLAEDLDRAAQRERDAEAMAKRGRELDAMAEKLMNLANQQRTAANGIQQDMSAESAAAARQREQGIRGQAQQAASKLSDVPQAQRSVNSAASNIQKAMNSLQQNQGRDAGSNAREATRQLLQAAQDLQGASQEMQQAEQTKQLQHEVERLAHDQRDLRHRTQELDSARQAAGQNQQQQQQAVQQRADALAREQGGLQTRAQQIRQDAQQQSFRWAIDQAGRRMDSAKHLLEQRNPGTDTQRHEENAAQMLDRIARALGQQAEGEQQQAQQQQSGEQGGQQSQMAQAQGELQLSREMQAQIRQETANLDERRAQNPERRLSADQERELEGLGQQQRETQQIARHAADQLKGTPDLGKRVQQAADDMDDIRERLRQKQTETETQSREQRIVNSLDQVLGKMRDAMRQQRQQMAQQRQQGQQQGQQGEQQMAKQPGGDRPAQHSFAPLASVQPGTFHKVNQQGRGFGDLSPRAIQAMREGRQDRVPAEYRDLVNQYFKALSERGK